MNWFAWRWRRHVLYWWAGVQQRRDRPQTCPHLAAGECDECIADYLTWGHPPH